MQRSPLGPVTPGRVDTHDDGILLDALIDLVADANDDDLLERLMDTFTTGELEQLVSSTLTPAPPPPPPRRKKKRTSAAKHSDAFKKVRIMR